MTWIRFALLLLGIYTIYYAVLISWDQLRPGRGNQTSDKHELTFVEDIEPVRTADNDPPPGTEPSVVFSGGVSLKQMFNLAREESVEYIKAVSF